MKQMKEASSKNKRAILYILVLLICVGCKQQAKETSYQYYRIQGETMGTYYNITYRQADSTGVQQDIDDLLADVNASLSTYLRDSYISIINQADRLISTYALDRHFVKMINASLKTYQRTEGAFDPTVMPLVNYYGFGYRGRSDTLSISDETVDSLQRLVGFERFEIETQGDSIRITKAHKDMEIDFSAIAKGYAVDLIDEYLVQRGSDHHLIDIGGDGLARGLSPSNQSWVLGINKPTAESSIDDFALTIKLSGRAIATSGNYRNYYDQDGVKYAHTINPKTALPEISTLLSTTIIADDCMTADAYATASMVLGLQASRSLVENMYHVEACWIHDDDQDGNLEITYSSGFEQHLR